MKATEARIGNWTYNETHNFIKVNSISIDSAIVYIALFSKKMR